MTNFLKENPQYKIGDKISLISGHRQNKEQNIDPLDFIHDSEKFIEEEIKEYTIVAFYIICHAFICNNNL